MNINIIRELVMFIVINKMDEPCLPLLGRVARRASGSQIGGAHSRRQREHGGACEGDGAMHWRGHAGDGLRLQSRGTRYRSDRDDVRARRRESLQGIAIGECFALLWRHAPPFHRTQTTAAPMVRVVEGLKFNLGLSNGWTIKIILS